MFSEKSLAFRQGFTACVAATLVVVLLVVALQAFRSLADAASTSMHTSREGSLESSKNIRMISEVLNESVGQQTQAQQMQRRVYQDIKSVNENIAAIAGDFKTRAKNLDLTRRNVDVVMLKANRFEKNLEDAIVTLEDIFSQMEENDTRFELEDFHSELIDQRETLRKEIVVSLQTSASSLKELGGALETTTDSMDEMVSAVNASTQNLEVARRLSQKTQELSTDATKLADTSMQIQDNSVEEVTKATESIDSLAVSNRNLVIIIGLATLLSFIVISVLNVKSVVGKLTQAVEKLTKGGESSTINASKIKQASQTIANNACELAAFIEETHASMEEMNGVTQQNSEQSNKAHSIAESAEVTATHVGKEMENMVNSMKEIDASSQEITKIVKTIDEIAFQTNILALNAAVEAARAGEAGAGFAIVADEVRNLAQRSAEAVRGTAAIVDNSRKKSEEGVRDCAQVKELVHEIFNQIKEMRSISESIATGSNEQSNGVGQINKALSRIDRIAQDFSRDSEQSAHTSETMEQEVNLLNREVLLLNQLISGANAVDTSNASTAPTKNEPVIAQNSSEVPEDFFVEEPKKTDSPFVALHS